MIRAGLFAAALIVSTEWASAQPPSPPASAGPVQADAEALAALVIPADLLVDIEVEWGRRRLIAGIEMDSLGKRIVAIEPGMPATIWAAVEPEYRKRGAERLPLFRQALAALYSARLTQAEIAAARTFYATATGRKTIEAVYRNKELQPIVDRAAVTGDLDSARNAIAAGRSSPGSELSGRLTAADEPAFETLTRTLSMDKFRDVGLEVHRFTLDWVNEEDPPFRARVDAILEPAFRRYFEKHPNVPRQ